MICDDPVLQAFVWGENSKGQLGLGDTSDRTVPVCIEGMEWRQIIACGTSHTIAVAKDGTVHTWGNGESGKLGHGNIEGSYTPKATSLRVYGKDEEISVACGSSHSAILLGDCNLYTWGDWENGKLGHDTMTDLSTPIKVKALSDKKVTQVVAGNSHTVVVTSEGSILSWGSNLYGKTGHGVTNEYQSLPKILQGLSSKIVVFVSASEDHTACLTGDAHMFSWGKGEFGRLGHGDEENRTNPQRVEAMVDKKIKHLDCGFCHTAACDEDGAMYTFGQGSYGQLGHGTKEKELTPVLLQSLEEQSIVQVAAGLAHTLALTFDGRVYSWGNGDNGRLGHESESASLTPVLIEHLKGQKVVEITSFHAHNIALVASKRPFAMKMKDMVNDESFSDIIFLIGDEQVHAHKLILMQQSEYFRAMFRSNMRESKENQVEIEDCSKAVFLLLMEYLYTNTVDVDAEHAVKLYVISDRYQEDDLCRLSKEVIERSLCSENALRLLEDSLDLYCDILVEMIMSYVKTNLEDIIEEDSMSFESVPERALTCGNVLGFLVRADELSCDTLKESCIQFIYSNFKPIKESEGIKTLSQPLLLELLLNHP